MAKYGLGQVDLNLLARLALRGFSEVPERDIAALLQSGQPIETETRMELATALLGGATMPLTLKRGKRGARYRSYRIRQKRLAMGRKINELMAVGTLDPVNVVATEAQVSFKLAELSRTFANRCADWLAWIRSDGGGWEIYDDDWLTTAFLFADVMGEDPMKFVRGNLEGLIQILGSIDATYRETRLR